MQASWRRRSRALPTWITNSRSVLKYSSFVLLAAVARPNTLPAEPDRLVALGKLWVAVEYFHPAVAISPLDWDAALLNALPSVRSANTAETYSAAISKLISALPATQHTVPQLTWLHYDLEHSAFVIRNSDLPEQPFDMGGGLTVNIQFSTKAQSQPALHPEKEYPAAPYPSTELRILAAYKLWGAVHYFFAYRDLMDADWDDAFPQFLQKFIDAKDAREYHLAVAQAATLLDDSRSQAHSDVLDDYFGRATVPLRLRLIDKKPLVTEVLSADAQAAGLQVGDIVLRADDEDMVKRIDREAAYLPASTHQALAEIVMRRILNGPPDSETVLTVRHHDGNETTVHLKRTSSAPASPASPVVKQLSGKIAYVDLTQLTPQNLDATFHSVSNKPSLILDGRGDLQMNPRAIAAYFNSKADVAGAILTGPLLLEPDAPRESTLTSSNSFFSVERVPASANPYTGAIVMLIDSRTINEAEHLGAWLKAALKIAFIGNDSAGACSPTRELTLPGGLHVTLSSTDVRLGDTGKLQRVGLTPAVLVTPDLGDIRAQRDVILDKAIEYLTTNSSQ